MPVVDPHLEPDRFVNECVVHCSAARLSLERLYNLYRFWCREQGFEAVGKKPFSLYLDFRGFVIEHDEEFRPIVCDVVVTFMDRS